MKQNLFVSLFKCCMCGCRRCTMLNLIYSELNKTEKPSRSRSMENPKEFPTDQHNQNQTVDMWISRSLCSLGLRPPTHIPTYPHTHIPTYPHTHIPTYPHTHSPSKIFCNH